MSGGTILAHAEYLAGRIGPRPAGSAANHEAAAYIADLFHRSGLSVEMPRLPCPEWEARNAVLSLTGRELPALANTFSPSCRLTAPPAPVGSVAELERAALRGRIGILYGDLTRAPLGAKNFPHSSVRDRTIVRLLEEREPAALITVSPHVRSIFPVIEDWDLSIPSVTVPAQTGLMLMESDGETVTLDLAARRQAGWTANVIGRRAGARNPRIILCAHYDTKFDTPGASDNASGVAALLALAAQLSGETLAADLEFVAFTSEEYYGLGSRAYVERASEALRDVLACINIDGIGQLLGTNTIVAFGGSEAFLTEVREATAVFPDVCWTEPWYAGDHTSFLLQGIPCIAVSCTGVSDIGHTPDDTPDWLGEERLAEAVALVRTLVERLAGRPAAW